MESEPKMTLTKEQARLLVYDDLEGWGCVTDSRRVVAVSRWSVHWTAVFHCRQTNKHYRLSWSVGATEQQDEQPFKYDDPELTEVVAKEVVRKEWVPVCKDKQAKAPAPAL